MFLLYKPLMSEVCIFQMLMHVNVEAITAENRYSFSSGNLIINTCRITSEGRERESKTDPTTACATVLNVITIKMQTT